ncbi:hypothetical protein [Acinetobacter phage Ab69]|nr:hypothetical protein [Acinetobacter phage Ab69]
MLYLRKNIAKTVLFMIDSLRAGTKCLRHATDEEIEKV